MRNSGAILALLIAATLPALTTAGPAVSGEAGQPATSDPAPSGGEKTPPKPESAPKPIAILPLAIVAP